MGKCYRIYELTAIQANCNYLLHLHLDVEKRIVQVLHQFLVLRLEVKQVLLIVFMRLDIVDVQVLLVVFGKEQEFGLVVS